MHPTRRPLTRRHLLGATAAAGVTGLATGCDPDRPAGGTAVSDDAPALDPASWDSVRAQFALDRSRAHLATFVFAPHPAPVRAAVATHRAGLDRDASGYLAANEERLDRAVLAAAAGHLGARSDHIALTDSTTMGLGLLYGAIRLRPGDEVLTTEHDFYATHESLRLRAERDGVTVRRARLYRDAATAGADEMVAGLTAALTPRTRVVALTWVHSSTGVKLPVRRLAEAVRERSPEALLCLDAVHGFGADASTPEQLGCDVLVSGCHKWLLGPRGTGLVWAAERAWARMTPVIPSFDGRDIGRWLAGGTGGQPVPPGPAHTPGGYHSFEHRWALADAFAFHRRIGPARVAERTRELAGRLKEGLAGIRGVRLVTPRAADLSAGVVCCEVPGVPVGEAVNRLWSAGVVASSTPYRPSYLRFGATIANGEQDVEAALRAVRTLA
ncbi:aminotransferase class V-fold PLP-dependent enzyme [Micromonospora tulbaghiae]|uniref:Aminotransferase class V-fold PLP-dependent enzyme n=1 Tax=Micromonospora tulbaghiae TaxID=479978 RepID=A0AAW4JIH2_9ACTN|nr:MULTISPECIES: aminotransferase class V-fold PLP-dependent enzyme [Micromonospora]KAB1907136.1 aminotransferase class V-fold PLP-dependent enzyme [Micromonospora sp. AMSO1212t]MBO4138747.1 aminotransferase class V-fold PLP-dependent enzyme [Micromonospora tulbaghiae]MDX5458209.1 aminotransferase class V-fold PLP-dependent enzyme [Micromonospora tulbaghiae]SCE75871.1 Selenocysteine lyase/Cysteine desulfurase [Micromonospora tulbaghiae]